MTDQERLEAIRYWFKQFDNTQIWEIFHEQTMWKYQNLVNLILDDVPVIEEYVEEEDDWEDD